MHCDLVQGYYLSPPFPAEALMQWLDDATTRALHG